jgi:hypothetical protein
MAATNDRLKETIQPARWLDITLNRKMLRRGPKGGAEKS